jgi:hypothetical protein
MSTVGVGRRLTRTARGRIEPWRERAIRLLWALRINRPESQRPLPPVRIDLVRPVPGWALRLVGVVIGIGCLISIRPAVPLTVMAGAALLFWLIRPGGVAIAAYTLLIGIGLLILSDPFAPGGFVATAAVHLLLALSCLIGSARWSTRFELSLLRPVLLRWLVIQAIVQAFGLFGRWIGTLQLVLPVLPLLAGAALVGFAVWLFPRLSGRR